MMGKMMTNYEKKPITLIHTRQIKEMIGLDKESIC